MSFRPRGKIKCDLTPVEGFTQRAKCVSLDFGGRIREQHMEGQSESRRRLFRHARFQ
jgi:hypothetical protein